MNLNHFTIINLQLMVQGGKDWQQDVQDQILF